ncbi:DUF1499 domain-containing protein [Roseibium denhamense]|uniref:DUF1499 domain-containing protein n=1 Tax=Roseibium denhamense TaxID=76305 RepID=A0ABY1PLV6_9HYPH|nr:DUF1499 domain-containing protein [Roseibium denhamense]MTI05852.1 DUF1499 domain-containing protein [Roseibium denhamense]SMP35482.1 Protein of unknown function [Roseibium denhamense]
MKWVMLGAIALLLCVVGAAAFFRLVPVGSASVPEKNAQSEPGDEALPGGFYAARPADTLRLDELEQLIAATPRTRRVAGSSDKLPMVFVHRSRIWGFPDVSQVWVENDLVHIYSHLVFGGSDLGVNRRRVEGWLQGR